MKIETFEDLERLMALVDTHRIELLEVDNIKIVKSTVSHASERQTQTEQARAGRSTNEDDEYTTREWDPMWDQNLLPNSRGDS